MAWNEADGTLGYYEVTATWSHADEILTNLIINGEWLETTPEHPFYVEGKGWVNAEDLQIGDEVQQADGTTGTVWLQWNIYKTQEMYNLTVDTAHTFFVGEGQWLVHNTCEYSTTFGYGNRIEEVNATVKVSDLGTGTSTNRASRNLAKLLGNADDDAGHVIGSLLGGPGGATSGNIFPQSPHFNRGAYRDFEYSIANRIYQTKTPANINVVLRYPSRTATRPSSIRYRVTIGDLEDFRIFDN